MKVRFDEIPARDNPCVSCGACCAYFRVEFYWRETEKNSENQVPLSCTEDLNSFKKCMKGTLQKTGNRCVALTGTVGKRVGCAIYRNRPTPCRSFPASYSNGLPNPRCDEARAIHGLPPLPKPLREHLSPTDLSTDLPDTQLNSFQEVT